ncbi:hypothetical protein [Rubrobacter indicoceani]|uniref:hypothetical protein n=1 Tax=Rubrobacter indicoceani TaxID=2051957 RepID=UPI000E5B8141|nr:hypothetical protein [Rubrobacter indicoceani]
MAKRGYTRDTIRGGASDWDVSRPFSSYLRQLGMLVSHPVRFYEVLPKVGDPRAPGLFLGFCGIITAAVWFVFWGWSAAVLGLALAVPTSLVFAGVCHLLTFGGRYEYLVTWRAVAYPFGFVLPFLAVPILRWVLLAVFLFLLVGVGLRTVREVAFVRAFAASFVAAAAVVGVPLFLFG